MEEKMVFYIHYSDGVANVFRNPNTLLGEWQKDEACKIPKLRIYTEEKGKKKRRHKRKEEITLNVISVE
jgi:hypothetical protein